MATDGATGLMLVDVSAETKRPYRLRVPQFAQHWIVPMAVVAVWEVAYRAGFIRTLAMPPPSRIGLTLVALLLSGQLFVHVAASLSRVLEGFAIAGALGLSVGVLMGISATVTRLLDVTIQLLRPIPPIAWIPLAILWFGIGEASKIYIIFLGALFPIVVSTIEGIRQTDDRFVELARVLSVTSSKFIRKVVVPGALPAIMTGLRVGLGNAWVCVVAAELIAAESGVGYIIVDGRELSRPDVVIAGMISIGVIGKLMDVGLKHLEARLNQRKLIYHVEQRA